MKRADCAIFLLAVLTVILCLLPPHPAHARVELDLQQGSSHDVIIYGANVYDGLGYPVFSADVNGDGIKDIIVSATAGDDGPDPSQDNCGIIYIIFGKNDPNPRTVHLPQDADVVIYGVGHGLPNKLEGDEAGYALASADLNGDGISDLVISAIYADGPNDARPAAGEVYVVYGRKIWPKVMHLATDADVTIYGVHGGVLPDNGDLTGYALATGDFNGDGVQDLVISAVCSNGANGDRPHSGVTYILWGNNNLPSVIDLASYQGVTKIWGANAGDYSGFSLFVKDINGDHLDDLMIGAPLSNGPGNSRTSCGAVYALYGKKSWPSNIDLANGADVTIWGPAAGAMGFNPVNYFGAADVNGDGYQDLVIGVLFANGEWGTRPQSGAVYIVFGKPAGFPSVIDLAVDFGCVISGAKPGEQAGFSLAFGDVNGDGMQDIIIGAPNSAGPYAMRAVCGAVYVVYGRKVFPWAMDLNDADVTIYGQYPYDLAGISIYSADVNGDGVDDILIGAPGSAGFNSATSGAGEAYVIYGVRGGIGLDAVSPKDTEVLSCQPLFQWTPGRPGNTVWSFQLFGAPDLSELLYTSEYLLKPTFSLPDNYLVGIPASRTLYWQVYGFDPSSGTDEQSLLFSFSRGGLHLVSPGNGISPALPVTLVWTQGCPQNSLWVVGISQDPNFGSFAAISPTLTGTRWAMPAQTELALPAGVPLYWKVMALYQPEPWRALVEFSQENWSFLLPAK